MLLFITSNYSYGINKYRFIIMIIFIIIIIIITGVVDLVVSMVIY